MSGTRLMLIAGTLALLAQVARGAEDPTRVWPDRAPVDPRLTAVRTLYQGSGFKPATDKARWEARAQYIREQVLIAAGLWPMPERSPLNAVVHSPIDCGDYTVAKVFFQSYPGFYVTGSLFRPKGKTGPFPGVLCPHGHWSNGRFYHAPEREVDAELKAGLEKDPDAARYPLQARAANLAKMGCVVFHYDMVGYADAHPDAFPHRKTFIGPEFILRAQSIFGLQTWNSIRALDFLCSLEDVDKNRLACTGASGGGTQTFILMTADPRLTVAAPVCMISAGNHQGGCVCENAPLLRLFTDNVEFAATFAPKPFVHPTATGDWTARFMEEGYPELRAIYRLMGAEENVRAVRFTAGHNYNLNSRQTVYDWFNVHLDLRQATPVREQSFKPIDPKDLSVFDAQHPRPANSVDAAGLSKYLSESAAAQIAALRPTDAASLSRYRRIIGSALAHMIASQLPAGDQVAVEKRGERPGAEFTIQKLVLLRQDSPERIPAALFVPPRATGAGTVLILPGGKASALADDGRPTPLLAGLLEKGQIVLVPDVFLTGELSAGANPATNPSYEFFSGYNRTTLGNRVHDILTAAACLKAHPGIGMVNLVGAGKAGPWCLLARALAGEAINRTVADADRFEFDTVKSVEDEMFLPAALRYGGLWPLAALAAPGELFVYNAPRADRPQWLLSAYSAAGALGQVRIEPAAGPAAIVQWLTR